ncbi:LOW QUALITY PROTEIN: hypothetical protein YC2023_060956 [Brassica napus]
MSRASVDVSNDNCFFAGSTQSESHRISNLPRHISRVRNRDDPWVTVTRLNPRGRVQGSSELEDPLQPSTFGNCSAAEDLAGVGLVVDLTDFGEEAVVHVEDEPVIGEFHQDPDSDSSGDDDSETDYH